VFLAVIKQQAVSVNAVGAKLLYKTVNTFRLLWCDFKYHRPFFLLLFSGSKKAAGFPTAVPVYL